MQIQWQSGSFELLAPRKLVIPLIQSWIFINLFQIKLSYFQIKRTLPLIECINLNYDLICWLRSIIQLWKALRKEGEQSSQCEFIQLKQSMRRQGYFCSTMLLKWASWPRSKFGKWNLYHLKITRTDLATIPFFFFFPFPCVLSIIVELWFYFDVADFIY